jgi:hypothetical protein
MASRRSVLTGLAATALAGAAHAEDRRGSTSAGGTASTNYATSGVKGDLSLSQLAALPKTVPPLAIQLKPTNTKYVKGKTQVAVATYGLYLVRSGSATAFAGGFGSESNARRTSIKTGLVGVSEPLANQLVEEAYVDLGKRLAQAGFEVAPNDAVQAALSGIGTVASGAKGINGQPIYGPAAAPVRAGTTFTGALSGLGNQGALTRACDALGGAIILSPSLGVDYEWLESSGNHAYSASASVGARLRFHALQNSGATFVQTPPPPYRGAWPGNFLMPQPSGTDEPFAIMFEVDDRSDNALVSSAMALAGFGSIYRQSKVYAVQADPDRYAALVRAAYQGLNASLVDELLKAKG